MALAPVIDFTAGRYTAMARQLLALGIPQADIIATGTAEGLTDLWTRERTIASLKKLTGCDRTWYQRYSTPELVELEHATVRNLMGADGRTPNQLIYSIAGHQSNHAATRRRQHLRAWGIPA